MKSRLSITLECALLSLGILSAPRALSCVPGCSGYHLTFTGPGGLQGSGLSTADRSATISWQDSVDGAGATFDILASPEPVPAYPMHSFPAELPGEVLALGLSATGQASWTWDTSQVSAGTYFLYAAFHNPPFNTLVMPFAVVAVVHGATAAAAPAAVFVRSPRGSTSASGAVTVAFDAAPAGASPATVDLYAGTPPDCANPVLVAKGLPTGVARSMTWDSPSVGNGEYVFKAVLRDASGTALASALSPGTVMLGAASSAGGCSSGGGAFAPMVLGLLLGLRRKRR